MTSVATPTPRPVQENVTATGTVSKTPKDVESLSRTRFNKDCLLAHNSYRKIHFAPPLKPNEHLRVYAQEWADTLARNDRIEHRPNGAYGENIYACEGFEPTGFRTVQRWYQEMLQYNFAQPGTSSTSVTGHFSQLVWRSTQRIGVGVARSNTSGNYYVVANYDPPGNVVDQYVDNVLAPRRSNRFSADKSESAAIYLPDMLTKLSTVERIRNLFRTFNQFQTQCLAKHNEYRARHSAPPLRLSVELCREAKTWAHQLAKEDALRSRGTTTSYGENLFSILWSDVSGSMPVEHWYAESAKYRGVYTPETSNFTQLVWLSTVELGVELARSASGAVYVVAYYYPTGNISGEHELNVLNWEQK